MAQVSGQSWGQAAWTVRGRTVLMAQISHGAAFTPPLAGNPRARLLASRGVEVSMARTTTASSPCPLRRLGGIFSRRPAGCFRRNGTTGAGYR
jgi:hypothetical protein